MLTNQFFLTYAYLSEFRFSQWWLQRSLPSSGMQQWMTRLYSVISDESNLDSCTAISINTASESTYSWWYLPKQSRRCKTIRCYVQCNVISSGHIMGSAHSSPLDRFFWCYGSWFWAEMWGACLPVTVQLPPPPSTHTCTQLGNITGCSSWASYIL